MNIVQYNQYGKQQIKIRRTDMKKKLLYGWHGEFGWEIMTTVPEVKALSKQYDVTLVGYEDTAGLYTDLDITFVPHGFDFRICGRGPGVDPELWKPFVDSIPHDLIRVHGLPPLSKMKFTPERTEIRQDISPAKKVKICIHARKFVGGKTGRNMHSHTYDTVEKMRDAGYDLVFIGNTKHSGYEEGMGTDARGASMEDTIRHIKESVLVFGPASGPMVLAQWCRTPIFTWSCGDLRLDHNRNSESKKWNPLETEHFHPWSEIDGQRDKWTKTYRGGCGGVKQDQIESGLSWTIDSLVEKHPGLDLPTFQ